ncbi:MAG: Gfo/Idh/MocA family oxidoreductase [Thermomicrobiales bacterium]
MSRQIGVGLVGAGVIGSVHAEALSGVPNARLLAVAEPREAAGRDLATKYGIDWTSSYLDLLNRDDVEVVILGTPSGMHPDQAILAAQHGKHIITEKPMAITAEGATRMIDAAAQAGVHLAVIFQNRLSPDIFRVRRAIEAGALGKLVLGQGYVHWHRTQEYYDANGGWRGTWALDGGGALMNQSIHTVDLLQFLMGGATAVQAMAATLTHDIETEDTAAAALSFRGGALGTIGVTTSTDKDRPVHIEIVGDQGKAVFDGNALVSWESEFALSDDLLTDQDRELVRGWSTNEGFGGAHRRQQQAIFNALERGDTPPFPGSEARKAVDIILGIYESARTGKRVDLA